MRYASLDSPFEQKAVVYDFSTPYIHHNLKLAVGIYISLTVLNAKQALIII